MTWNPWTKLRRLRECCLLQLEESNRLHAELAQRDKEIDRLRREVDHTRPKRLEQSLRETEAQRERIKILLDETRREVRSLQGFKATASAWAGKDRETINELQLEVRRLRAIVDSHEVGRVMREHCPELITAD